MDATDRLRDGQTFGRYQIVRLIGEGGMGAVYEAIHLALKKRFAIKTLLPAVAQKEEARVRFLREGEAASSINHPNVVAVSDFGTEDGIPYLVMDFLEGQTLGDLLAERGALGVAETLSLLLPVISAVATGHDRGVIHRDLKPQNVFLAKGPWGDRIPKVLDFGVSKMTREDNAAITRTLTVLGTAAYMSPEQARGAKRVDFPSDQYALGLILYEMLTGSRAHPGENSLEILHNVASGAIRPARELKPDLSADLDAVLTRMLAASPADRFPSLHDCGRSLLRFADTRTRSALTNAFGDSAAVAGVPDADDGPRVDAASGSSAGSDSPSGSRIGTQPLPVHVADGPSTTTLRQAAIETDRSKRSLRRSSKLRLGLAAAVGVAVVVGAIVWTARRSETPTHSSSISDQGPATPRSASSGAAVPMRIAPPTEPSPSPKAMSPSPSPSTIPFEIRAVPPEASIALDDRPPTRGRLEMVLPLAGSSHEIRVSAAGYLPKAISFGPNDRPPAEIRLYRVRAPASPRVVDKSAARLDETGAARLGAARTESSAVRKAPLGSSIHPIHAITPARLEPTGSTGPTKSAKPAKPVAGAEPAKAGESAPTLKHGSNNAPILK